MKKYDTFLVDADDTLLDFHASSRAALEAAFHSFQKEWKEEYAEEFFSFNDTLWEKLERKQITRERLLKERFPAYLERLGVDDVPGEEFNKKYLDYLATHPIYMEGAKEFLEALNGAGRVYIVTNGTYSIQTSRFDIAGLWAVYRGRFHLGEDRLRQTRKGIYRLRTVPHSPFRREKDDLDRGQPHGGR